MVTKYRKLYSIAAARMCLAGMVCLMVLTCLIVLACGTTVSGELESSMP